MILKIYSHHIYETSDERSTRVQGLIGGIRMQESDSLQKKEDVTRHSIFCIILFTETAYRNKQNRVK